MKIPDHTIDEIRQATDIVDLVGTHVRLRKRGKNHIGLCPFHKEKTPSFNVSAERQMWHCFGCGEGGNVFTFLMKIEKLSFVEAVRSLAKTAGIEIPDTSAGADPGQVSEQEKAHALLAIAAKHFHQNLTATQEGKMALEYLRHRGISDAMITQFGLGYSLHSWDALLNHAREQGYAPEFLERYGLARKRDDGGFYDYFRGRVMFPAFTPAGKVAGFGARKLREDDPLAKYVNSPETPLYAKSRLLYGLSHSKEAIREADAALVVEGYMDLISAFQAGVKNVIASSGTALTMEQVQLVRRYTRNVTIVYDADSAGSKAALRGVDVVLAQDMDVKVAQLPEGEDPDSFVRKEGAAGMRKLVDGALSFVDFIIAARRGRDDSPEERSKTVRILVATVAQMPDALKRDFYLKHIAAKFAVREAMLQDELARALKGAREAPAREYRTGVAPSPAEAREAAPADPVPADERELLEALLRGGEAVARFVFEHVTAGEITHPVARELTALVSARMEEGESLEPAALVDAAPTEALRALITELLLRNQEPSRIGAPGSAAAEPGSPMRVAADGILSLKKRNLRALKKQNQESMRQAAAKGGDSVPFLRRNTALDEELSRLEKEGLKS